MKHNKFEWSPPGYYHICYVTCTQMEILKKLLAYKEHKTQKQPLRCVLQKWLFDKKPHSKCNLSGNIPKIFEKTFKGVHFWFFFSCGPAYLLKTKLLTTLLNYFSTFAEQLLFIISLQRLILFLCFVVSDAEATSFNLPVKN